MTIGALLLAAGQSRRMGAAKLALPYRGRPLITHALAMLDASQTPTIIITGAHEALLLPLLAGRTTIHAAHHAMGLAHSLHAGLAAIPADWTGFLVMLADMPNIRPDTITALKRALASGAEAAIPTHQGRRGNPIAFARQTIPALMTLRGDSGARTIINQLNPKEIPVSDPGILQDIDRKSDL